MIDVGSANARANELRNYASQLYTAKSRLRRYKSMFGSSWQAREITFFSEAICRVEANIIKTIAEMESLATAIENTAKQIRQEEEAAERARKEAEERARKEAEDRARKEAEDRARKEAEEAAERVSQILRDINKKIRKFY